MLRVYENRLYVMMSGWFLNGSQIIFKEKVKLAGIKIEPSFVFAKLNDSLTNDG